MLVKFEQNRMVQTRPTPCVYTKNKTKQTNKKNPVFKNHFWQSVDAILEDVCVAETFV